MNRIEKCRICGNRELVEVLDLGVQALTGVFPSSRSQSVTSGPLKLVKCMGEDVCGLLQLQHSYDLGEMYGLNYGYRSGLNASMVEHLHGKVRKILQRVQLAADSLVIDIGSNDSTTLQAYPQTVRNLVGIDPTGVKFGHYYPSHIKLIPDFFSARLVRDAYGSKKAAVITSFSMFYDLEEPLRLHAGDLRFAGRRGASGYSNRATCRPCSRGTRTTRSVMSTLSTTGSSRSSGWRSGSVSHLSMLNSTT